VRFFLFCNLWEVGRYGCQNDGLDELDTMAQQEEGGREGGRAYLPFFSLTPSTRISKVLSGRITRV